MSNNPYPCKVCGASFDSAIGQALHKIESDHFVGDVGFDNYVSMTVSVDMVRKANTIYQDAVAALGPDLGGFSPVDLLADNLPLSLSDCRLILRLLKIPHTTIERGK